MNEKWGKAERPIQDPESFKVTCRSFVLAFSPDLLRQLGARSFLLLNAQKDSLKHYSESMQNSEVQSVHVEVVIKSVSEHWGHQSYFLVQAVRWDILWSTFLRAACAAFSCSSSHFFFWTGTNVALKTWALDFIGQTFASGVYSVCKAWTTKIPLPLSVPLSIWEGGARLCSLTWVKEVYAGDHPKNEKNPLLGKICLGFPPLHRLGWSNHAPLLLLQACSFSHSSAKLQLLGPTYHIHSSA